MRDYCIGSGHWPGLSKLTEETGELLQVLGKLVGSEGNVQHWSGDLNQMMIEELGDVLAAIEFFMTINKLDYRLILQRMQEKVQTFNKWHQENLIKE